MRPSSETITLRNRSRLMVVGSVNARRLMMPSRASCILILRSRERDFAVSDMGCSSSQDHNEPAHQVAKQSPKALARNGQVTCWDRGRPARNERDSAKMRLHQSRSQKLRALRRVCGRDAAVPANRLTVFRDPHCATIACPRILSGKFLSAGTGVASQICRFTNLNVVSVRPSWKSFKR